MYKTQCEPFISDQTDSLTRVSRSPFQAFLSFLQTEICFRSRVWVQYGAHCAGWCKYSKDVRLFDLQLKPRTV